MAAKPDAQELTLLALIDAEYTRHPLYSNRKIKICLRSLGYKINCKRVQRLIGMVGLLAWHRGRIPAAHNRSTRFIIGTCSEA
jgi:hypothetical protein